MGVLIQFSAVKLHMTQAKADSRYNIAAREFMRRFWQDMLVETDGNVSEAARRAGVHRSNAYVMMKRANIPVRRVARGNWGDLTD